jgi:hypothetical protein
MGGVLAEERERPNRDIIERAEDALLRLREIRSVRISTDEVGNITEIHIVAATDRPPKMIARDVETCLSATLGLTVDYRKIGVVLVDPEKQPPVRPGSEGREKPPSAPADDRDIIDLDEAVVDSIGGTPGSGDAALAAAPPLEFLERDSRIRFKSLRIQTEDGRIDVEVTLEKSGLEVVGGLGAVRGSGQIPETIAGATLHALGELLDEGVGLRLAGVREIEIGGRRIMLASIEIVAGREIRCLTGSVPAGVDPNESAALAVLDALNRPLGRWRLRTEIHYTIK